MMIAVRVLILCAGLFLLHAIPTWLNDAVNALPKPLPEIIGMAMFIVVAVGLIALINKLLKGTN
jgi:hypothetical protein